MRKFYLMFLALFAMALTANAGVRKFYSQDFEDASDAATVGWASPNVPGGLSIASDEYGKFFQFAPGNTNDRSAHLLWGESIVKDAGVSQYSVIFDFCIAAFGNNHVTTEIAVMSDETTCTSKANGNFKSNSTNFLFDLSEDSENSSTSSTNRPMIVNGDASATAYIEQGTWYTVTINVDTEAKTAEYTINSLMGDLVAEGVYNLPEDCNPWATGIYYLAGRYWNTGQFDNINVLAETEGDVANKPSASLTGVNNSQRVYTINFMEGETLHISFNGKEETVSYDDCEGVYVWSNNPNFDPTNEDLVTDDCGAGTLTLWTTYNDAVSESITVDVENNIIPLVKANVNVVDVNEGYAKTYSISADNSTIPMIPQLFFNVEFIGDNGNNFKKEGLTTGATVELPGKGTLTITTQAFGYKDVTTTIENNIAYKQAKLYDFAHMTEPELAAIGFNKDANPYEDSKWSGYGRFYYWDAATYEEGSETNTKVLYQAYPRYTKLSSTWTDNVICPGLRTVDEVPNYNLYVLEGIGLNLAYKAGDAEDGSGMKTIYMTVDDLTDADIIKIHRVTNYGANSLHPVANSMEEYIAQVNAPVTAVLKGTDQIDLYRFDNCISRIVVYSADNEGTGINSVESVESSEDAPIYTISGTRVNKNYLKSGFYVQKGRKFIVK